MTKLTNKAVLEVFEGLDNMLGVDNNDLSDLSSAYDTSVQQTKNLYKVFEEKAETPKYMYDLFTIYQGATDLEAAIRTAELMSKNVTEAKNDKPLSGGEISLPEIKQEAGKKFVLTSAQNNTDIHDNFYQSLLTYCKEENAKLIIGKFVYNKNGFQNGVHDDEIHYEIALHKHFLTEQKELADGLTWCGELNILPTVKHPLTGFAQYTGQNSAIIPHAKIALESIATAKNSPAKFLYATGTVTKHNYIQKKAGQLAQSEHCYGALIVEVDENGQWFARQIQTDESGIFQDLKKVYHPDKVLKGKIEAINYGDLHAEKSDLAVLDTCQIMRDKLKPKFQFFHDTLDMTARNHHNRNSGHFLAKMHYTNSESVYDDLLHASGVLKRLCKTGIESYIVESNHDEALKLWLDGNDYNFKNDPVNAIIYLELQTAYYKALEHGKDLNMLEYALVNHLENKFQGLTFLNVDQSLLITPKGVECGQHGHLGANGARGNPKGFSKLNQPMNTGHTHAASIHGQVYTAGVTGSLEQGYNRGASSWSHSHIITYPTGFRTIITFKPDEFDMWNWKA